MWLVSVNLTYGSGFELQVDEASARGLIDEYSQYMAGGPKFKEFTIVKGRTKTGGETVSVVSFSQVQAINVAEMIEPKVQTIGGPSLAR